MSELEIAQWWDDLKPEERKKMAKRILEFYPDEFKEFSISDWKKLSDKERNAILKMKGEVIQRGLSQSFHPAAFFWNNELINFEDRREIADLIGMKEIDDWQFLSTPDREKFIKLFEIVGKYFR